MPAAGTTRASKHLPCYSGHVPKTMWGRVGEHGLGTTTHDFFHATTNLSMTFHRCGDHVYLYYVLSMTFHRRLPFICLCR